MKILSDQRFLAFYSGGLTAGLAVLLLSGAASKPKTTRFEVIEAQRVNIVEPDGTLRLAISAKARFPGMAFKGKEFPHPGRATAGMLFYNEEGTESGGLIFGGRKGADGKAGAGGSLTFDQYEQDQVVQVTQQEFDGSRMAGLKVNDVPEAPLAFETIGGDPELVQRLAKAAEGGDQSAVKELAALGIGGANRVFIGKNRDRSAAVELKDAEGRKRLVLQVAPDGAPSMVFLDADGKELDRFPRPKGG